MILSDKTILNMLKNGRLSIEPLENYQIQPASVDICLGNTFSMIEDSSDGIMALNKHINYKVFETEKYLLLPGQFVLATTIMPIVVLSNYNQDGVLDS